MTFCTKTVSALAALVLSAAPIWTMPNITALARDCNSRGNQKACRELAELAQHDMSTTVRFQAVSRLNDQTVLSAIALEEHDGGVRTNAVGRLTDQTTLAKVALEDKDENARRLAVERLTDKTVLAKVALEDKDEHVRKAAVERSIQEPVLTKIALEDKDENARKLAVERLTDKTVLAKVALEDKDENVRKAAVERSTQQTARAEHEVEKFTVIQNISVLPIVDARWSTNKESINMEKLQSSVVTFLKAKRYSASAVSSSGDAGSPLAACRGAFVEFMKSLGPRDERWVMLVCLDAGESKTGGATLSTTNLITLRGYLYDKDREELIWTDRGESASQAGGLFTPIGVAGGMVLNRITKSDVLASATATLFGSLPARRP